MNRDLVLSIFPGIDLLGRAFEECGYCVVRGPDLLWGGAIESFRPTRLRFNGIIGGSPCQDFSTARRSPPSGEGERLLGEFARVVGEAMPVWFLLENVPSVPSVCVPGYFVQRLTLCDSECGGRQRRLRCFQFGSLDDSRLMIDRLQTPLRPLQPAAMASEGKRTHRRSWAEFCALQGLPEDFTLPGMSVSAMYRAVGNGVPLTMGRAIANAVTRRRDTIGINLCVCQCGRPVQGRQTMATASCRKRMERQRDAAGGRTARSVTLPGNVSDLASGIPAQSRADAT